MRLCKGKKACYRALKVCLAACEENTGKCACDARVGLVGPVAPGCDTPSVIADATAGECTSPLASG
ncbi:hypothetical protein N8152_01615 [bacterium]|nr:hypothetical protein [bacterium]